PRWLSGQSAANRSCGSRRQALTGVRPSGGDVGATQPLRVEKEEWMRITTLMMLLACIAFPGCMSAARHYRSLGATQDRALTVGVVQKEITVGLGQSDVAVILGAPNIVTRDSQNRETGVY